MNLSAAHQRAARVAMSAHSEPVTLVCGGDEYSLAAIPDHLGRFSREVGRAAVDQQGTDFIFLASDLQPHGKPERSWKVRHASGSYQALPAEGRALWEYEPGDFMFIRLHCKRLSETANG